MPIVLSELRADAFYPDNLRINDGIVERTPDGGGTWLPSPQDDARQNPQYLFSPLGSGSECDAAISMVQWIHDRTDAIIDGLNAAALVGTIALTLLAPFEELLPAEIFLIILIEIVTDAASVGATTLDTAMTDTVYADLVCILRCLVTSTGQLDAGSLAVARQNVIDHYPTTPEWIICAWFDILGFVGLSNAGTLGLGSGDCDDCDDCYWFVEYDFTGGNPHGWMTDVNPPNVYGVYTGAEFSGSAANGRQQLYMFKSLPGIRLVGLSFYGTTNHGTGIGNHFEIDDLSSVSNPPTVASAITSSGLSTYSPLQWWVTNNSMDHVLNQGMAWYMYCDSNGTGSLHVHKLRLQGIGDPPTDGVRVSALS